MGKLVFLRMWATRKERNEAKDNKTANYFTVGEMENDVKNARHGRPSTLGQLNRGHFFG